MGYFSDTKTPRQAPNDVDGLLRRVLALPSVQLYQFVEGLVGRVPGWNISERRISPRPQAQRDEKMTRLHDSGKLSYPDIARLYHLKPETVARAIQRFRQRQQDDSDSLSPSFTGYAS